MIEANVFFPYELGRSPPPGPAWLRLLLGDDAFAEPKIECFGTRGNLRRLEEFPRLTRLQLILGSVEDMKEMASLGELHHLTYLELATDYFGDAAIAHLAGLERLEELDLRGALVSDGGLRAIAGLQSLRVLRVGSRRVESDVPEITDAGMECIAKLSRLEELDIEGCRVSDKGVKVLRSLPRLRTLDLSLTDITDATLEEIERFPRLERVNITETNLTPAAVAAFQQSCPRIEIVALLPFTK